MLNSRVFFNWSRLLLVTILALGIFFRFTNLGTKFYWIDETYTSLRISGYTEAELIQEFSNSNNIVSIQDLQKYRHPNSEKGLGDTINSLILEDPQHPPLYYVMTRWWVQWFGNSVAVTRSLSAFVSLLAFPCIYWLCQELFESPLVGWIAIALIAVSPFHVLYAQEARPYSLWTVAILLSSAALLKARRLNTKPSWGVYAVSVALGLYSSLFSVLVLIAHGIYVFTTERFRFSKRFTAYIIASFTGLLAFTPWLLIVINSVSQIQSTTKSLSKTTNLFTLVKRWIASLSVLFLDVGLDTSDSLAKVLPLILPITLILILVGYSLYFLCRNTPQQVWLFIFLLIGVTAIALALPDLIAGGRTSSTPRFLIPCYLGIQIAIAYLFATKISFASVTFKQKKLWQLAIIAVISAGVLSCAIAAQAEMWWNKAPSLDRHTPETANLINGAVDPLVVSDAPIHLITPLTYRLNPKVQMKMNPYCYTSCRSSSFAVNYNISKIPESFKQVFLFKPSKVLKAKFHKEYKIESVNKDGVLRLQKKDN